jgi:tRNA pseudouridine55 synthase
VLVGRATRLARFLPDGPKHYVGALRLGVTSLTDDAAAPARRAATGPLPAALAVAEAARGLEGEQLQIPPAISARRVGGQRLYRLNRTAARVEGPARPVIVHRFLVRPTLDPDRYTLDAVVSAGTYVRGLARDLGAELGCGAILVELRRTEIGPFRVEEAVAPEGVSAAGVSGPSFLPLDRVPLVPPDYRLDRPDDAERFVHGLGIEVAGDALPAGPRVVTVGSGRRLGIGMLEAGHLRPRVVLVSAA